MHYQQAQQVMFHIGYQYNARGYLARINTPHGHTAFDYDSQANLTHTTLADGTTITHDYRKQQKIRDTHTPPSNNVHQAEQQDIEYNYLDRITQFTDAEGNRTQFTYNGLGERLTRTSPATGNTQYAYDSAGNLSHMTDARGITRTYQYDALNRLTRISFLTIALSFTITVTPTAAMPAGSAHALMTPVAAPTTPTMHTATSCSKPITSCRRLSMCTTPTITTDSLTASPTPVGACSATPTITTPTSLALTYTTAVHTRPLHQTFAICLWGHHPP